MTRYWYEVLAPKGDRVLCKTDEAALAWRHVDDLAHAVPGCRVEVVTITIRREPAQRPGQLRRVA